MVKCGFKLRRLKSGPCQHFSADLLIVRISLYKSFLTTTTLLLFAGSGLAAASTDLVEDLRGCARITDKAARIACYEELGKRALGENTPTVPGVARIEPNVTEAPAVEIAAAAPVSEQIPEDLGTDERKTFRGHVGSCGQMSDDRWYFVFDNGQVWNQSSSGKYRFKECDFDVTITKDFFGFKMKIDGGKTLRVKRRR